MSRDMVSARKPKSDLQKATKATKQGAFPEPSPVPNHVPARKFQSVDPLFSSFPSVHKFRRSGFVAGSANARASWSAATESSESPLWGTVVAGATSFGVFSGVRTKAVTSQTPSPQSKTWRSFSDPSQGHGFSSAPADRKDAEYLKRLIHEGDWDLVSGFLEQMNQEGGVV